MTSPELSKHLQLNVTNLGPIARADIELRPMTVFVGPSNTGKSYLAILIYALHRFFSGTASRALLRSNYGQLFGSLSPFGVGPPADDAGDPTNPQYFEPLFRWIKEYFQKSAEVSRSQEADAVTLPEPVVELLKIWLESVGRYDWALDAEITRCFGVEDTATLVRNRLVKGSRVAVTRLVDHDGQALRSFGYSFTIGRNHLNLSSHIPSGAPLRLQASEQWGNHVLDELYWVPHVLEEEDDEDIVLMGNRLLSTLSKAVGQEIVSPLSLAAHYLPADRTGVMHAHRVVVGSLISQAARAGFERDTPLPRLSGVLADFLEQLIGLEEPKFRSAWRGRESLAGKIESEILQGEIRTARSPVGYPEFLYRPEGWKDDLGLMNTSSMVSELAPVVLYLRYVAGPGETLIIEEPESHLHPALQVEFTRQLAAVARAGVRVIITTHSEWVLEELANLVRLSELPESGRKGIGGAPYALNRDQLGIWLFEPKKRPKGSVVREIPFDPDVGNFDSGFDEVAMATYNDQAEIIRREERLKARAGPR